MDYQSLHIKTVAELRGLAKSMGVRIPAGTNKGVLIEMLLEADRRSASAVASKPAEPERPAAGTKTPEAAPEAAKPRRGRPRKARPESGQATAEAAPERTTAEAAPVASAAAAPEAAAVQPAAKPAPEETVRKAAPERSRMSAQRENPGRSGDVGRHSSAGRGYQGRTGEQAQGGERQQRYPGGSAAGQPRNFRYSQSSSVNPAIREGVRPRYEPRQEVSGETTLLPRRAPRPEPQEAQAQRAVRTPEAPAPADAPARGAAPETAVHPAESEPVRARREGYYNPEYRTSNPAVPELLAAGECGDGAGVLEIQQDGYGFLRAENCLPGPNDVYISIAQIRRFNLRMGDYVVGKTRPQREGDRYSAMLYITEVNGDTPERAAERPRFEDLVPIYPDERLRLEPPVGKNDLSLRLIDMLAPIGKGQRGMIVSQPKAGKTTLLKKVANAITAQYPDVHLIVLLIDERPEEVTDMQRSIDGEVVYSTFDEAPENHARVSEMVLERAQRLVEMGQDVVVLMDSITRLARAYNLVIAPTGRSLSGGLDPGALFKPKRFFGAARNIENGGSLTIIATALVETGSRMDDIIFEEFKGTGNMELHLDRKLSDKRVFPAIDMVRSGTRREELLLSEEELEGELQVRRMLSGRQQEMSEELINLMSKTASNAEFFQRLKGWMSVYEKDGYTRGR